MDKIEELLTRGVDTIYPTKEELEKALRNGKKLTLYQGFDPTGTQLHIGHMIGLKKLRQWQDLGHHVIFLIGDGTGQAGDPSGKLTARDRFLTREELKANAIDYVKQAGKIVRFEGENPVEIKFNGDWLNKLSMVDILEILGHLSLQQLEERDLFEQRKKKGQTVNMREFIYPVLQGYDSVAMEVDLELGGSDQLFNMLVGRQLLKAMKQKDKFVMTTPLLADSEGRKIGKTEGNVIALTDTPQDLYGKLLTLPDDVIVNAFAYLTNVSLENIQKIENAMKTGENPMIYKKQLAFEITKDLNSQEAAQAAQENFEKTVQQKELPTEITEVVIDGSDEEMVNEDLLVALNLVSSKSEAKRLFMQHGIEINGEKVTEPNKIAIAQGMIIKIGKRKIIKLTMKS